MNFCVLLKISSKISVRKNLSTKYSRKAPDHAKQSAADVLKTASKKAIQNSRTVNLIGNNFTNV